MSAACQALAVQYFTARHSRGDFGPGAGSFTPGVVARALRVMNWRQNLQPGGKGHRKQRHVMVDVGANKGRYSASLFDAMCGTVPRREVRWRRDTLGQQRGAESFDDILRPMAPKAAACPIIYAIEPDPALVTTILRQLSSVHGFPPQHFHVVNAAFFTKD